MIYGILLSSRAEHDLARLPVPVRRQAFKQLEVLREYSVLLSYPSNFSYPETCQAFQFDYEHEGRKWELCALFKYSQDEKFIHIILIGFSSFDVGDPAAEPIPPQDAV
jgi:hypothetical protein